jgi:alkyldihydroxyacetonephosphate synthase
MLAHYPSSVDISTLGGYLAARGSGVMSTKYGKAEDMVLSVEVVLPNGDILDTLSYPNHANGPGLLQLFVGSEGTLGVITRVRVRLDPLPQARRFQMVTFPSIADGLEAGRRVMVQRFRPAVMRLYDEGATARSLQSTGHQVSGVNLVVMTDGAEDLADAEMSHVEEIARGCGGQLVGEHEGAHWWEHRYDFYKPPLQPGYPQLYGTVETVTDYASILPLYDAKKAMLRERYAQWAPSYTAHFSHWYPWGTMIYDRFYIDSPPDDAEEVLRLHNQIWADCSRLNLQFRGVLNEHHGIGLKLGWLMEEQSPTGHRLVQQIKDVLDPAGIMNPGKLGFAL